MILTDKEQAAVNDLQAATAVLNDSLALCHQCGVEVKLETHAERFVGKETPLLIVSTRCRSTLFPTQPAKPETRPR